MMYSLLRGAAAMGLGLCLALTPSLAWADDAAPGGADAGEDAPRSGPALHFSVGAGGAALLTGADGDTWRGLAMADLYPGGGFGQLGALVAVRSLILDDFGDAGMVTAGLAYDAAAARPLLDLALHGDVGVTFGGDARPAIGGGLKTTFCVLGPLAIATDVAAHFIANDVDDVTFVISAGAVIGIAR